MEMQTDGRTEDASIATMKEMRSQLESRVETQHNNLIDVLNSFQSIIPSIDLSRKIVSSFNNKPFVPTPVIQRHEKPAEPNRSTVSESKPSMPKNERLIIDAREECEDMAVDDGNKSPLSVVRSMVAMCLLERVPFVAIDSSTVLRKLENDESLKAVQKAALRDLGGESGAIQAVEMALRSMAEDNGGVELEEFVVSGKSRVMILGIDRNWVMKELPEGKLRELSLGDREKDRDRDRNSGGDKVGVVTSGVDVNGKGFGMGGSVGRQVPDMWLQPFGPAGAVMGGPGSAPRMMGMMGMPRGMGVPQLHRPFLGPNASIGSPNAMPQKVRSEEDDLKDLEVLLNKKSFKEMQQSRTGEELLDLIHRPTAKETAVAAKFKTKGGSQVKEYCSALTKEDCRRQSGSYLACEKVHFRRIIAPHTDVNLGDCSFLDTCRHMKTCKYVHYELDTTPDVTPMVMGANALAPPKFIKPQHPDYCSEVELGEPQWINCDIRSFRMDILGQFGVIMADPPWDIHMELPYGTMADDEMRNLNVPALQTDGLIFLWVTGRAMELGRECLEQWGYKRIEEIIWVKTNQLQRIIRTGRTGHWLNHSKEHCLVGIKGNPIVNRNIDTDVIVAEVRETSRKPDEMYPMLERISPRTRKLELFARMHNTQAGWMSLGNQLNGVRLVDEGLRARFKAAYPDVEVQPSSPPRASAMEIDSSSSQMRNSDAVTESKCGSTQFTETAAQVEPYVSEGKPTSVDTNMAG